MRYKNYKHTHIQFHSLSAKDIKKENKLGKGVGIPLYEPKRCPKLEILEEYMPMKINLRCTPFL